MERDQQDENKPQDEPTEVNFPEFDIIEEGWGGQHDLPLKDLEE